MIKILTLILSSEEDNPNSQHNHCYQNVCFFDRDAFVVVDSASFPRVESSK